MKPKTEEELEAERLAAEAAAAAAAEAEKNQTNGTQRSKLIHNPDDPMDILGGQIEEENVDSQGNIKA